MSKDFIKRLGNLAVAKVGSIRAAIDKFGRA